MREIWTKKIGWKGHHNAFTDLLCFEEQLYCCYREATNHISSDGRVLVLTLTQAGDVTYRQRLSLPDADLRDPKLSVTPDGKLLLHAQARFPNDKNQTLSSKSICWYSTDGNSWSQECFFGDENWWLWRLCWINDKAIGFAYNRGHQSINLYQGDPRRTFELTTPQALSLTKHNKGYPNESDIIFLQDGTAIAIVRRDADTFTAQLGKAVPPYKKWQWQDLNRYIGGPAMLKLNEQSAIVSGRSWTARGPITQLFKLKFADGKLLPMLTLPSSGDCSYPGLTFNDEHLYVSHYSSHGGKTCVYLSKVQF